MLYQPDGAKASAEQDGMSHLSIEVGHLYPRDLARPEILKRQMDSVAGSVRCATEALRKKLAGRRPRVSTCYLVDEYSHPDMPPPRELIDLIAKFADGAGLRIDYLSRESTCARMGTLDLAALVVDRLEDEPQEAADDYRPSVARSGWLCNGTPGSKPNGAAMGGPRSWTPRSGDAEQRRTAFLDVELWKDTPEGRRWSCPLLAAIWQLLRLGVLSSEGRRIGVPQPVEANIPDGPGRYSWAGFPETWDAAPPIIQLNPDADPFPAYRTVSILPADYLEVEHAVRTICRAVRPETATDELILEAAAREGLSLPNELTHRLAYVFQVPL